MRKQVLGGPEGYKMHILLWILLWILGLIIIIAAVVSPINIILWGTIGILLIVAGFVIRNGVNK